MHTLRIISLVLAMLIAAPVRAELEPEQVRTAIDRGVAYLKREQNPDGTWPTPAGRPGGVSALCTLALLNAGVEPGDPAIQKALTQLRRIKPKWTYVAALQTMVFAAAEPKKDLVLIRRNAKWLEEKQLKKGDRNGAWSYPSQGSGDNSNSQFAILALHEAERAGVTVSEQTWRRAHRYWRKSQNPDGSWGYLNGQEGTGSMTCAGIGGLVITAGKVDAANADVVAGQVQCCGAAEEGDALDRALQWLGGRRFSVHHNPGDHRPQTWLYYYLYGVERVGRLTARRFIGAHDWYREGAEKLVEEQDDLSGFWKGEPPAENDTHIATSLALLFLSKGRRPVVAAKLKHGPGEDWNNHKSDLANLVAYTEKKWERDLTWQVIEPEAAKVEDLLQAPVLFIGGQDVPEFREEDKQNLRQYIDRGGFIFAEACCRGTGFDRGFRQLMAEVFPEPEYKLRPLTAEHPVWHAEQRVPPGMVHPIEGIDYGCRTCVVYLPPDGTGRWKNPISCFWELGRSGRQKKWPDDVQAKIDAAYAIGVNVLTYATGRRPKHKDEIPQQLESEPEDDVGERGTLYVAKLLHPGGCNAAPGALVNLLRTAGKELNLRVSVHDRQLAITDKQLFRYHLVFMHGRHKFTLTPEERTQLKEFLERGGTLFADSICASSEFTESFRREMRRILPTAPLERIAVEDPLFTPDFGGYDIRTVTRRDPRGRSADAPLRATLRKVEPHLEAATLGDRYAVIFSPYDISCALEKHESLECNGYIREDAARIGLNVILYSLHE